MSKSYYASGKRGMEGGVPVWRPAWWDELGNDAEYKEAVRPRTAFKAPYYADGHRMIINGIPTRVSAHVKDWAPWMRRVLYKGSATGKENAELKIQIKMLFGH